jgi:hypothetical protein
VVVLKIPPPSVAAYTVEGDEGTMASPRTWALVSPALEALKVEPPSVLL